MVVDLSFHEYSSTQFFIVFILIIFGSESMGSFFAHSSGKYETLRPNPLLPLDTAADALYDRYLQRYIQRQCHLLHGRMYTTGLDTKARYAFSRIMPYKKIL